MFNSRFFGSRYYAARYWQQSEIVITNLYPADDARSAVTLTDNRSPVLWQDNRIAIEDQ